MPFVHLVIALALVSSAVSAGGGQGARSLQHPRAATTGNEASRLFPVQMNTLEAAGHLRASVLLFARYVNVYVAGGARVRVSSSGGRCIPGLTCARRRRVTPASC